MMQARYLWGAHLILEMHSARTSRTTWAPFSRQPSLSLLHVHGSAISDSDFGECYQQGGALSLSGAFAGIMNSA